MLLLDVRNLNKYLESTYIIDYKSDLVQKKSEELAKFCTNDIDYINKAYEFVRDEISHSYDENKVIVTFTASEVLQHGHGSCHSKSYLLAALLRNYGIPVGFCYQNLLLNENDSKLILHGLNAVYLRYLKKWIRLDARGNKENINADFLLFEEKLAFNVRTELGESDMEKIYAEPLNSVISSLTLAKNLNELWNNLSVNIA